MVSPDRRDPPNLFPDFACQVASEQVGLFEDEKARPIVRRSFPMQKPRFRKVRHEGFLVLKKHRTDIVYDVLPFDVFHIVRVVQLLVKVQVRWVVVLRAFGIWDIKRGLTTGQSSFLSSNSILSLSESRTH